MKKFSFSLDKLHHYKEQVLDSEKNELLMMIRTKDNLVEEITRLEHFRVDKKRELSEKQRVGINVSDTMSYTFMIDNAKHQLNDMYQELAKKEIEINKQKIVVTNKSTEVKALDKLEDKQKSEYNKEVIKEMDNDISEFVSSLSAHNRAKS